MKWKILAERVVVKRENEEKGKTRTENWKKATKHSGKKTAKGNFYALRTSCLKAICKHCSLSLRKAIESIESIEKKDVCVCLFSEKEKIKLTYWNFLYTAEEAKKPNILRWWDSRSLQRRLLINVARLCF